jgi:glycerol-3-phosphate acyltransferase PlsY
MMDWLFLLLILLAAYLIGSIPTGYIIVRQLKGIDIRTVGSGSTGATNVKRILGTKFFIVVMLLDLLKGFLPLLALKAMNYVPAMIPNINILSIMVAVLLVVGHSKSIYLKFSGGKSVATSAGVLLALSWPAALCATLIWVAIRLITKYVSLASIIAVMMTPILMWIFNAPVSYVIFTLLIGLYVSLYLHKDNIKRLWEGTESKTTFTGENK